jgi:hypothetical protein
MITLHDPLKDPNWRLKVCDIHTINNVDKNPLSMKPLAARKILQELSLRVFCKNTIDDSVLLINPNIDITGIVYCSINDVSG